MSLNHVPASNLSVFDIFSRGIGPSSSHTVGPMRAGLHFVRNLPEDALVNRVLVQLFGSLGATGVGHGTDRAVLLGLAGESPETVSAERVDRLLPHLSLTGMLPLFQRGQVRFNPSRDLRFEPAVVLPIHVNALSITAFGEGGPITKRTYYSVGGGFVLVEDEDEGKAADQEKVAHQGEVADEAVVREKGEVEVRGTAGGSLAEVEYRPRLVRVESDTGGSTFEGRAPYLFETSAELLAECTRSGLSIAELVRKNEEAARPRSQVNEYLNVIIEEMFKTVEAGCTTEGVLPGGLEVPRRAASLRAAFETTEGDPLALLDWVTLYALAVNEENAAGHRVVTAPTNGAAGVLPAVLGYFLVSRAAKDVGGLEVLRKNVELWRLREILAQFPSLSSSMHDFLLASVAVGAIIKTNASIAGAEVGCQGEIGSASAMAAAGLAAALGGSPGQVENAAEIAMEHSLGLTCDPVGGLVQIPCIERNAIGAVKAISAARMALYGDGRHRISLDVAIETMKQTGADMLSKYKETSVGGLAVNIVEC